MPVQSSQASSLTGRRTHLYSALTLIPTVLTWTTNVVPPHILNLQKDHGKTQWVRRGNHFPFLKPEIQKQLLALFSYYSQFGVKNFSFNRYPSGKSILGKESLLQTLYYTLILSRFIFIIFNYVQVFASACGNVHTDTGTLGDKGIRSPGGSYSNCELAGVSAAT